MTTKKLKIIVTLMILALIGIMFLQYIGINTAYQIQKKVFRENVNYALNIVVEDLEKDEIFRVANQQINMVQKITLSEETSIVGGDSDHVNLRFKYKPNKESKRDSFRINIDLYSGRLKVFSELDDLYESEFNENIIVNTNKNRQNNSYDIIKNKERLVYNGFIDEIDTVYDRKGKSIQLPSLIDSLRLDYFRNKLIKEISSQRISSLDQINMNVLDSLIYIHLKEQDIETPYCLSVRNNKKTIQSKNSKFYNFVSNSDANPKIYEVRLFPKDLFFDNQFLQISFAASESFILYKVLWSILLTLIFVAVIISTFIISIITIIKQKKLSDLKNDFINNMTHELKTPIASIALASEALLKPKKEFNKEKMDTYNRIISDENIRLASQVDKILQLANLEKGAVNLEKRDIVVHDILHDAAHNVILQIEEKKGTLKSNYTATNDIIFADKLHFTNVIYNLLDNALKYCKNVPNIIIDTFNEDSYLCIKISDNGIGIKKENLKYVFDKFYRVPTGNMHNVKGFGLGLTYVKLITEAHFGEIEIVSELNKGTAITLKYPLQLNETEE